MPFGESFLATIKSNKSIMLDKSRRFRKTQGGFDWSKSQQFNFPKATSEELERISEKLRQEQRLIRLKTGIIFLAILITAIILCQFL